MKKEPLRETQNAYKSISRAARILSCLSDGKNSVTDIAEHCQLSKPTVSRLLAALERSNLVIRDPLHRKYFLGYLLNSLVANPNTTHLSLITLSAGEMNRLSGICGETVALDVLVGIRNIRLHMIPSIYSIRVYDDGSDLANVSAEGAAMKALLSQLNLREMALAMRYMESEDKTGKIASEKGEIVSQLNRIREQGYAISKGERIEGALAIAAPIQGYHLPATLTVLGIESRLEPRIAELLPEIVGSANRISTSLRE